jgi:hypothetical protein
MMDTRIFSFFCFTIVFLVFNIFMIYLLVICLPFYPITQQVSGCVRVFYESIKVMIFSHLINILWKVSKVK